MLLQLGIAIVGIVELAFVVLNDVLHFIGRTLQLYVLGLGFLQQTIIADSFWKQRYLRHGEKELC